MHGVDTLKMFQFWRSTAPSGPLELAENRALRFVPGRPGVVVRVCSGRLVVTQEGDREDYVLGPGEELRLSGRDPVVVWAVGASRFVVRERPPT